MICPECFGTSRTDDSPVCPECGGFGVVHCCEGDREQPSPKANEPNNTSLVFVRSLSVD